MAKMIIATEKERAMRARFPVSTSQNRGNAQRPASAAASRHRLRRPTRSESAAKIGIPSPMMATAIMVQ